MSGRSDAAAAAGVATAPGVRKYYGSVKYKERGSRIGAHAQGSLNMMSSTAELQFKEGPSIRERWDAARRLMASKTLPQYVETAEFAAGWAAILEGAAKPCGVDQLLHIDLIIRISGFIKHLKTEADQALTVALRTPIPKFDSIERSGDLPKNAKPAELRENIAISLRSATGDWVRDYVLAALATEDRSQRCRVRLVERLVDLSPSVEDWMDGLLNQQSLKVVRAESGLNGAAKRLKELALALAHGVRENRRNLHMSEAAGIKLGRLASTTVQLLPDDRLPTQLSPASAQVVALLDELLNVRLSLMVEPQTYSSLSVIRNWWRTIPYPNELVQTMEPVVSKLDTAITIRARAGQKSDALVGRLADALGNRDKAKRSLAGIAEREVGLLPEIDDWLRGRERVETDTAHAVMSTLKTIEHQTILTGFAPLLVLAAEAKRALNDDVDARKGLRALTEEMLGYARDNHLDLFGEPGDVVDYSGELYSTRDGRIPADVKVRVTRPGVLRSRVGGGHDILAKATVE